MSDKGNIFLKHHYINPEKVKELFYNRSPKVIICFNNPYTVFHVKQLNRTFFMSINGKYVYLFIENS